MKGDRTGDGVPFSIEHVLTKILAPGLFADLNAEQRDLIYLVADTGLRPSEACNLLPQRIVLDCEIPYLQIRPDLGQLKTLESARDIPLSGLGLKVMMRNREGFLRCRNKANSLSAVVSNAFAVRGLIVEGGQRFYSLRHTFRDRLVDVDTPMPLPEQLMGHAWFGTIACMLAISRQNSGPSWRTPMLRMVTLRSSR